jgi:hypothetical protein
MPRHDFEARKLARQGREWAEKVLRKEDIEVRLSFMMTRNLINLAIDIHLPSTDRICTNN